MCSNVTESGIKLTATLESQSPMIHFQAREIGAVLRASEVKPKLDRFLIKKLKKRDLTGHQFTDEEALERLKEMYPEYFRDVKLNDALNYKMRIIATTVNEFSLEEENRSRYAPFFANSGKEGEEKLKGVFVIAELTIVCFNKMLREIIKEYLEEFFIVTNFGMMQGKGFGSFIVTGSVKMDQNNNGKIASNEIIRIAKQLAEGVEANSCYYMEFDAITGNAEDRLKDIYKKMFNEIKLFYGIMKSGYNINNQYARSYINEYMHDHYNLGNEKKWMKQNKIAPAIMHPNRIVKSADERQLASLSDCKKILENATSVCWMKDRDNNVAVKTNQGYCDIITDVVRTVQSPEEDNNCKYVRALLGTAIQTEFKTGYHKNAKRNNEWCLSGGKNDKVQVEIADPSKELERVPSPICFKIIKNVVFIVAKRIPEELYGKTFEFSSCWEDGKKISTPTKEELTDARGQIFDIETFLKDYVNYYNSYELRKKVPKIKSARIVREVQIEEGANE